MGNGCFFIEGPFDGGLFRFFNGALKRDWLLVRYFHPGPSNLSGWCILARPNSIGTFTLPYKNNREDIPRTSLSNGHFSILSYKRKTRHYYSSARHFKSSPLYLALKPSLYPYIEVLCRTKEWY